MKRNYIILLLTVLGLVACQNGNRQQDEKILTVSIEPVRYFAEAIAGEHFKVVSMVPEGGNPETYDPTPQQMVKLNKSQAFLRIGYIGFEQVWMDKLTKNVPQMEVFDLPKGFSCCRENATDMHTKGTRPEWSRIYGTQFPMRGSSPTMYTRHSASWMNRTGNITAHVRTVCWESSGNWKWRSRRI